MTQAKNFSPEKLGYPIFLGSLIFYFLFKLPLNFSVLCGSSNEGYYFLYGQFLLNGKGFGYISSPLLKLFYAAILKIFKFGPGSIIAVHFIQTTIVISIGVLIYLIVNEVLKSKFYAGLSVLFLVLIMITPIGDWGSYLELESSIALESEYFCVFLSLLSIYCFLRAIDRKHYKLFSFMSGFLTLSSAFFKASGAVLAIAVFCWLIYLLIFERELLSSILYNFVYFYIGFFLSLLGIILLITVLDKDIVFSWQSLFILSNYSTSYLASIKNCLHMILSAMQRSESHFILSNFILFAVSFLSLAVGLLRGCFFKREKLLARLFIPLLAIWFLGNFCAVIAPGAYGSYYYILLWPSVSIFLIVGLKNLFDIFPFAANKYFKFTVILFISFFFISRIWIVLPAHINLAKLNIKSSFFLQPQLFQYPVVSYDIKKTERYQVLNVADIINSLLPDKNDKVYIFHFSKKLSYFNPSIYIYIERLPPTLIICDYLHYNKFIKQFSARLISDLEKEPPKIIITPQVFYLRQREVTKSDIQPLLDWLDIFLNKKYKLKFILYNKDKPTEETTAQDIYGIYERI